MDNNISIKEIEPESKRKSTYRSRVIDSYNGMKEAKIWFWATFIGLAVNIALSFTDMIEVENYNRQYSAIYRSCRNSISIDRHFFIMHSPAFGSRKTVQTKVFNL